MPHENSYEQFNSKEFFETTCDLIVAECSYPSIGLGIELGWANYIGTKVIAIYKKESKISGAVGKIADTILECENVLELFDQILEYTSLSNSIDTQKVL